MSTGTSGGNSGALNLLSTGGGSFNIAVSNSMTAAHGWVIPLAAPAANNIPYFTQIGSTTSYQINYGSVAAAIGSQSANLFYASPNGSSGILSPRAIAIADLPAATVFNNQGNTFTTGIQDFTAATSLKVPFAATPIANGAVGYDTSQHRYTAGEGTSSTQFTVSFVRALSAQLGASDSLDCNTIGTTETAFATQYAIPANLLIANKTLQISGVFDAKFNAAVAVSLSARLHAASNMKFVQFNSGTPANTGGTLGAGFTLLLQGTTSPGTSAALEGGVLSMSLPVTSSYNTISQPVTVDTTAIQTIQITLTCGGAGTGTGLNVVKLRQLVVQEIN